MNLPVNSRYTISVIYGMVTAIILMLTLSFLTSLIVYFSPLNETLLSTLAPIIDAVALLAGGFIAGRSSGGRGLLIGLSVAALTLAILFLLPWGSGATPYLKTALSLVAGMIGGVLGVR